MISTIERHIKMYPGMKLQDMMKLIYQSSFGCGHLIDNENYVKDRMNEEWEKIEPREGELIEPIGNGYCRVNLAPAKKRGISKDIIEKIFILSATLPEDRYKSFECGIRDLKKLSIEKKVPFSAQEIEEEYDIWEREQCPYFRHSYEYNREYSPAYRVCKKEYGDFIELFDKIHKSEGKVAIAIDGRCASGKTSLADRISSIFECPVIHADDFFLPPELRTSERLEEAGGNFHYERFNKQVVSNLKSQKPFEYDVFSCSKMSYTGRKRVEPCQITVIEGSYCMRPEFQDKYDIKVFLTVSHEEQKQRIVKRNGIMMYKNFEDKWIPMEEKYFSEMKIREACDFVFET